MDGPGFTSQGAVTSQSVTLHTAAGPLLLISCRHHHDHHHHGKLYLEPGTHGRRYPVHESCIEICAMLSVGTLQLGYPLLLCQDSRNYP